jgi:hypothetical protein
MRQVNFPVPTQKLPVWHGDWFGVVSLSVSRKRTYRLVIGRPGFLSLTPAPPPSSSMNSTPAASRVVLSGAPISAAKDWVRFAKKWDRRFSSLLPWRPSKSDTGSATVFVDELDAGLLEGAAQLLTGMI